MFHYDLNDLLLLQAISDCQNLTRGAEKIGLTAPSASVRIRKLEDALKVKLLKRSPKGVELTSAGKLVVDQSKKVFWAFEGMASSLRPFIRKEEGLIKIFDKLAELSGQEIKTAQYIQNKLEEMGFNVRSGVGGHGLVVQSINTLSIK